MKIPYYFGMSIMLLLANIPNSYSSYSDIHLIKQIKPYTFAKSKPAFSYPQFAAVSFLKSDSTIEFKGSLDVKSQCGALGYVIQKSKCTGDMKPSKLCSDDPSMKNVQGADAYTTGCCDSRIYTVKESDECPNNAAKLSNDKCYYEFNGKFQNMYRCACDRGRYQYSTIKGEWCGMIKGTNIIDYTRFNANLACKAYEPRTQQDEYYFISCCPASYSQCDSTKHQMGRGNECRVIGGGTLSNPTIISKFEECVCATHYDTICTDGKLIDVSNYCTLDNGVTKFTTETNCESDCTKTSETNIDDYLYGNVWHCLYEPEGATLKQSNEELKGGLCNAPQGFSALLGVSAEGVYDECHYQGYTKSEADCYDADTIIHCPTDPTKVWCMEGRYCTGYDVGAQACMQGNMTNPGANIELCSSSTIDKGIRCKYKADSCNKAWSEGVFDNSSFVNYDTSKKGDDEHCCKRGYVMNENGICVANSCTTGENAGKYPYDQNPSSDQGTLEICYQADPNEPLGYKAYFGYSSCNDDPAKGGMWIQKGPSGAESRQCICARNGEGGRTYYLPFDSEHYFGNNLDSSDNYTHTGFNQGVYGETQSCTDSEGSYYGYLSCYIGKAMGTKAANKGMCIPASGPISCISYWSNYDEVRPFFDEIIKQAGGSKVSADNTNGSHCIIKKKHCEDENGNALGDESACALVTEGCITGKEQACGLCYNVSNLTKDENGLYTAHGLYKLRTAVWDNTTTCQHFQTCPDGYTRTGSGMCYKKCYLSDMAKCNFGDTLVDDAERVIGGVYYNSLIKKPSANPKYLRISSIGSKSLNWNDAKAYAAGYYPEGYELDLRFGKGQWHLLDSTESTGQGAAGAYPRASLSNAWTVKEKADDPNVAYFNNWTSSWIESDKSSKKNATPVLKLTY